MDTLRFMTYNIRNMNDDTGEHCWANRKPLLAGLLQLRDPDIYCVQEAFHPQMEFLLEAVPGYASCGVGRDDGGIEGEYSAVFYKTDRFEPVSQRTYWLSETPDVPSRGWDAPKHKRICTKVTLREKATGEEICVGSLHLDNEGVQARVKGAELVRELFLPDVGTRQCFIAGDFNAVTVHDCYKVMNQPPYWDARLSAVEYDDIGTFHGYKMDRYRCEYGPIDHVFCSDGPWKPRIADIIAAKHGGNFPSDHFPLMITFSRA